MPFAFFQKIAKRSVTPQRTRVFLKVRCNLLVYPSAQGVSRKLEYPGRHTNNMANTWSSYVAKKVKTITRSINLKAWEIIPFMYPSQTVKKNPCMNEVPTHNPCDPGAVLHGHVVGSEN